MNTTSPSSEHAVMSSSEEAGGGPPWPAAGAHNAMERLAPISMLCNGLVISSLLGSWPECTLGADPAPLNRKTEDGSTGVAQARREPGDRNVDAGLHAAELWIVLAARAIAPHQLDLEVIERVEVREAVLDRARQRRIAR